MKIVKWFITYTYQIIILQHESFNSAHHQVEMVGHWTNLHLLPRRQVHMAGPYNIYSWHCNQCSMSIISKITACIIKMNINWHKIFTSLNHKIYRSIKIFSSPYTNLFSVHFGMVKMSEDHDAWDIIWILLWVKRKKKKRQTTNTWAHSTKLHHSWYEPTQILQKALKKSKNMKRTTLKDVIFLTCTFSILNRRFLGHQS